MSPSRPCRTPSLWRPQSCRPGSLTPAHPRPALCSAPWTPGPRRPLPRVCPTHPPRSPTPTNPTSRSFERRRLQSLQQPLWPPTPPRKESSPPPAAPSLPGRGSSGVRTSRLRRKRTRAARIVGVSARPAALRGGSGAGPFLPEDVCRAEAPARREENARAPWLPVMERSLGSRCHRRRRAPAVIREDPASLRARPRPVALYFFSYFCFNLNCFRCKVRLFI